MPNPSAPSHPQPKRTLKHMLLALACCAGHHAMAQTRLHATGKPKLRMVVILGRHGVRSPTWTPQRLDSFSTEPWPTWPVPPGNLTPRGHELIRLFGAFDRASLAQAGLLSPTGCADADQTFLWADTDQRTSESAQALAEGLFPGCAPAVHGLPAGENDSLFHPTAVHIRPGVGDAALKELATRAAEPPPPDQQALIAQIQRLLQGCAPDAITCTPSHPPANLLPTAFTAAQPGKGDHLAELTGPLGLSSTFAEDFLLEYADGRPMPEVAWGRLDEPRLGRLLALHSKYFELMHRTPSIASAEASNLLFHILRTLEQASENKPVDGAIGPAGSRLVVLLGHDTNLAALAALLGLHWDLDGTPDDTPPGTQMVFSLWQTANGESSIGVSVRLQTRRQMRERTPLTLATPPAHQVLRPAGCPGKEPLCPLSDFQRAAETALDPQDVFPTGVE